MQNFSQATDIDLSLDLKIIVEPLIENGPPYACIYVNKHLMFDGFMNQTTAITKQIGLSENICICIDLSGKTYDEVKETALNIRSITVDSLEIKDHCWQLIKYDNDQNNNAKTMYLGFNGKWQINIPGPFYRWWHAATGQGWLLYGSRSKSRD